MTTNAEPTSLLTVQDLRKIERDAAVVEAQRAALEARKAEEQRTAARKAFLEQDIQQAGIDHLMSAVKLLASQGKHEFLVLQFPAELLTDGGRRVNNFDPDWPDSLQGFPKKAYDYYLEKLKPAGYHLRAQILNYPNGNLGDVGFFLCW
jgi:hypothetical protein